MYKIFSILIFSLFCLSCSTTDFNNNYGLRFKEIDWEKSLERPFLVNSDVSPKLTDKQTRLFLPAKLFNNTTITAVYYNNMKSSEIELIEGEKRRIRIDFDRDKHQVKNFPYELEIDQAVVEISVLNSTKIIKIEDMRVPFYHKEEVAEKK